MVWDDTFVIAPGVARGGRLKGRGLNGRYGNSFAFFYYFLENFLHFFLLVGDCTAGAGVFRFDCGKLDFFPYVVIFHVGGSSGAGGSRSPRSAAQHE